MVNNNQSWTTELQKEEIQMTSKAEKYAEKS